MPFTSLLDEIGAEEAIPDDLENEADEAAEEDVGAEDPGPPPEPPEPELDEASVAFQAEEVDIDAGDELTVDLEGARTDGGETFDGTADVTVDVDHITGLDGTVEASADFSDGEAEDVEVAGSITNSQTSNHITLVESGDKLEVTVNPGGIA